LRLAYTNLHNNGYTSNRLICSFLSAPLYSHRIKTTKPLTARPQSISITTLFTAPLSLPPHPTTHPHNPTLLTRVLFKPHNPLFPHWSIHIRASNTSIATRTRHHDFIARSLSTHRPVFPPNHTATLPSTKQLPPPPPSTPPLGQHAASRLSSAILFLKTLRILCLCLLQPRAGGRGKNAALRAVALPGAAAPRYNIYIPTDDQTLYSIFNSVKSGNEPDLCSVVTGFTVHKSGSLPLLLTCLVLS